MIREATHDDLPLLVEFCLSCNDVMPWKGLGITPSIDDIILNLLNLIESKTANISIVDIGIGVSGVCAIEIVPFPWERNKLVGMEWIWHMSPSFPDGMTKRKLIIRMLDHMIDWSSLNGATLLKVDTINKDNALISLLKRRGINPIETSCAGVI